MDVSTDANDGGVAEQIHQLVDPDGTYRREALERVVRGVGVAKSGLDYALVAIMGPQSSGKSTLLNAVFGTTFREMDAMNGRKQTTRGVWVAKAPKCHDRCTLVLDMEGSDGRERGEHDTYEKQSALFAMAVADVLIVNMWCHDIGRETGAGKPLLRTVMQVNFKLFHPTQTVLLFVIRDRSKTPKEKLEQVLREDMDKLWESIQKPEKHKYSQLQEFFDIKFVTLPNYEEKEEEFRAETTLLRRKFSNPEEPSSLVPQRASVPIDALPLSAEKIWETIVENKDLDLPAHQIMIATIRCDQIASEQILELRDGDRWKEFVHKCNQALVEGFATEATTHLESCLKGYEEESMYFDEDVRTAKREELVAKFSELLVAPLESQLLFLQETLLGQGKKSLEDALSEGQGFSKAADACTGTCMKNFDAWVDLCLPVGSRDVLSGPVRHAKNALKSSFDEMLAKRKSKGIQTTLKEVSARVTDILSEPVVALLEEPSSSLWRSLTSKVAEASDEGCALLKSELKGFALSEKELQGYCNDLKKLAEELVEGRVKEAAQHVVPRMRNAFNASFMKDSRGLPRTWGRKEDIPSITKEAYLRAADTLALLCVRRLGPDDESVLEAVEDAQVSIRRLARSSTRDESASSALLSKRTWPHALLTPAECVRAWSRFDADAQLAISQAMATQEAHARAARASLPPWWALAAIAVLGMDEFMAVLRSPLLLLLVVGLVVVARIIYLRFGGVQPAIAAAAVALAGGRTSFQGERASAGTSHPKHD